MGGVADRWISFDCYGTLVDWRAGMGASFSLVAPGHADAWVERYRHHEEAVEDARTCPTATCWPAPSSAWPPSRK
jgi:hypothetical protein